MTCPEPSVTRGPRSRAGGLSPPRIVLAAVGLLAGAAGLAAEPGAPPPPHAVPGEFHATGPQLEGLIEVLLEENPALRSARAAWRSRLERVPQSRSLPDPQLSYRYFARSPETRVGPQEHALELSQGIPWRGKLGLQALREEQLAGSAAWQVRDLERSLVAELKKSYYEAAYLREALTVNAEEKALLQRFEQIALTRYRTGEGIQQSVVKVQTDISRLSDQETSLHQQLDVAVRRIAELIGRPETEITLEPVDLSFPVLRLDPAQLESEAVTAHPIVRAVQKRVDADETWSRRRSLEGRPDFRLGLGYTLVGERDDPAGVLSPPQENGKDVLAFTVGINLPVFRKKIRAGIAEAEQSARSGRHTLESTQDRLRFEVQEALLRAGSYEERGSLYREAIIPQAEESLASAEAAYVTDKQDFLDLLDAERVLFQVRLTYHRLLADYWKSLAGLERALGRPFPGESEMGGAVR